MRTPLVVVTGVDPSAVDNAMLGLSWDLPRAVAVRHLVDPGSQVLTRIVSHAGGVLEREEVPLEHACVTCALREDIVPTLERFGRDSRWSSIVAALPTATEATQLGRILASDHRLARHLRLSGIVTTLATQRLAEDLLGDDLLRERGWHTNPGDDRGVGEVSCAQIEYADVLVLADDPGTEATDLIRTLARPDIQLVIGFDQLDGGELIARRHQHKRATAWYSPELEAELSALGRSHAWRLDLSSPRPFHPERLLDQIERLGTGRHRSRGCFWVPTRPGAALEWSGAGGQLSIGSYRGRSRRTPLTRLLFTGLGSAPAELLTAFEDILLTPTEALVDQRNWNVLEDGLEPWLGDIREVA
ncbi:GTP-binding protein [Actinopolymorpha pittospori]|uniref:G3E family GTPase n=1 Tax=Actinopolymorpha pittospori TaxID=648752 RepID=A0A927RLB7_9ACTN|nr:GTP-binding protein [Actinopolymorpha pittospori]MBE1609046.1 G3E family GTPase [Actinopolymorpha pittospori]